MPIAFLRDISVIRRRHTSDSLAIWQSVNPPQNWREKQPPEGWTRSLLARQLRVSHAAVASWKDGTRLPMVDAVAKIEKLTGIAASIWMKWCGRKPQEEKR